MRTSRERWAMRVGYFPFCLLPSTPDGTAVGIARPGSVTVLLDKRLSNFQGLMEQMDWFRLLRTWCTTQSSLQKPPNAAYHQHYVIARDSRQKRKAPRAIHGSFCQRATLSLNRVLLGVETQAGYTSCQSLSPTTKVARDAIVRRYLKVPHPSPMSLLSFLLSLIRTLCPPPCLCCLAFRCGLTSLRGLRCIVRFGSRRGVAHFPHRF